MKSWLALAGYLTIAFVLFFAKTPVERGDWPRVELLSLIALSALLWPIARDLLSDPDE